MDNISIALYFYYLLYIAFLFAIQMEWVRRMNAARAAATEIVNSELIYR